MFFYSNPIPINMLSLHSSNNIDFFEVRNDMELK